MQRITWYALLAVVALVVPVGGQTPSQQQQMPRANVRELATIEGQVWEWVLLPSRRTLIYQGEDDRTFAYDIATGRRTLLGTNMEPGGVSPQGDRFAFNRTAEGGTEGFVWTVPIDPRTGLATGDAQRVSLRPTTGRAKFSPDGRMLVFRAGARPDGTSDLTLVPATGGAERVLNFPSRVGAYGWSADGESLYVERPSRTPPTVIERVPLQGGPREPLVPWTRFTNDQPVGLSPDARVAFIHANPDRFFYRTASGVEGEISVPLPAPYDDGDVLNMDLRSLRFTATTQVQKQRVRVLDLTTGQSRDLLPENVQSNGPAWSPDGRRLAVLSGNLSHHDITVVNADGSSPRVYPVPMHLDGWFEQSPDSMVWQMPWSPDGRHLAFRTNRAPESDKVGGGPDDQYELALLDLDSGQTRVLATSSGHIGRFVWRSDGKAIRTVKWTAGTAVPFGSPLRRSIVEIPLDGPERVLRDISGEFPRATGVTFMSDRAVVVSVATDRSPERFLVPLDGGAVRRLPDPGSEPGLRGGGGTGVVAGNQLLVGQIDANGELRAGQVVSTVGDPTRTLRFPHASSNGVALPDGRQFVSVGRASGASAHTVFLVPIDGSAPRLVGEISPPNPNSLGRLLAPSPDGRLLAYTADGGDTTRIFEVDLGPAIPAILNR